MSKIKLLKYPKYEVEMTKSSVNDLNEIIDFIAKNNHKSAVKVLKIINSKMKILNTFPYRAGFVPELLVRNIKDYRQISEAQWRIIFKLNENIVSVLAIIDSKRNFQNILIKKLL